MPRFVGLGLLLVGSLALGLGAGHVFFGLFEKTVPPAVITSFNKGAAYFAFLGYGFLLGFVVYLWTMLAMGIARVTGARRPAPPAAAPVTPAKG